MEGTYICSFLCISTGIPRPLFQTLIRLFSLKNQEEVSKLSLVHMYVTGLLSLDYSYRTGQ